MQNTFVRRNLIAVLAIALSGLIAAAQPALANQAGVVEATLNGLKVSIDERSGSIVGLEFPGVSKLLDAPPEKAGIVDVAYPIPEFDPLRLASRHSSGARVEKSEDSVVISWDELGPSRPYFKIPGKVSAKVWLRALPDGRSISMKCEIKNESERPIGQVLFPDFHGFLPMGGKEGTFLRSAGFVRRPFLDVGMTDYPEFYALDDRTRPIDTRDTYVYTGGRNLGNGDSMIGRWLDYGSLDGGISIFPKLWAGDEPTNVRIFRMEKDPNVRLAHFYREPVEPGATWQSPEYVLTPHQFGWAKGIETYKEFLKEKIHRLFPVPKHVREGLGFRTVVMGTRHPADGERDAAFRFTDLPKVAAECKENGLDEMVIWAWRLSMQLPSTEPYANLGTGDDLSAAIKECHKIGVNVSLFNSIVSLSNPTAARHGLKVGKTGWTYHPEMIPRFNPEYATGMASVIADVQGELWQKEALADVKHLHERYSHSVTWDQANRGTEKVFKVFLPWVKTSDPRATFSGEITHSPERLADYLDYTWNWESGSYHHNLMRPYRDVRAFNASFPAPRLNYNINRNAQHIKYAFMDNSYVNIFPSAPDSMNGTAWIGDYPQLSPVLKQCAALRKQFLPYFVEGTLIGECLLAKPVEDAHVNAYVLPDKVLLIVMNTAKEARSVTLDVNLDPWLKSKAGSYELKPYDEQGKLREAGKEIAAESQVQTPKLRSMEMAIYELIAK